VKVAQGKEGCAPAATTGAAHHGQSRYKRLIGTGWRGASREQENDPAQAGDAGKQNQYGDHPPGRVFAGRGAFAGSVQGPPGRRSAASQARALS